MSDETTTPPAEEATNGGRASALRSSRVRIILAVVLLALILGGGWWFLSYQTHGKYIQSTNDAYIQADAVVVAPKVAGYAAEVFVTDNQPVKAGQPLLRIDSRDYQAQSEQARAQIDVAMANAQGVRAQISEQQAAIAQARAQLAAAESGLTFARNETQRYAPLAASGAETHERLAQLRDQQNQATARVAQARAAVTAAERRVGTLQAQVGQALSQGRAAQAQLNAASVNVDATIIRASIDGRIGSKSVQQGQFVQPGVRLMSIVPVQKLYVTANFKETQLGLMRVGQPVTLGVDALPDVKLHGHVESMSPGTGAQFSLIPPQNATGNFTKIVQRVPVRVAIDAGPETRALLIPGMSVEVEVDTRSAKGADERIAREQDALNRAKGRK